MKINASSPRRGFRASVLLSLAAAMASLSLSSCTTEEGVMVGALGGAVFGGLVGHASEHSQRSRRHYNNNYGGGYYGGGQRYYGGGGGHYGYQEECYDGHGW